MSGFQEIRMTRQRWEHIALVLDGNSITAVLSDGLKNRQDDHTFPSDELALEAYNASVVEAALRGFTEDEDA